MKKLGLVLVIAMLLAGCRFTAPPGDGEPVIQIVEVVVTATPEPTDVPAPKTTLELILSRGYVEFPMDCESGACRAFDNDDLGVRFILFNSGVVCMFPEWESGYDRNTQLDLVAEVFYIEGLETDAIQWMYRNADTMERGDAEVETFTYKGSKHQIVMVLVPNKAGVLHMNINIVPANMIQNSSS